MRKVCILLSSYNGESVVNRQIQSILNQEDVDIHLIIRDDGSSDNTYNYLRHIEAKCPDKIRVIRGNNIGWAKSFFELIFQAGMDYDYYGFSDQDDLWMPQKTIQLIQEMENDSAYCGAKLAHCNSLCVNERFSLTGEQQKKYASPKNYKMAIAQEYFQGCSMLWNRAAMCLVRKHMPTGTVAHDYWVGLVCYLFGKIYYTNSVLFFHIRYRTNASQDGNVLAGRLKRLNRLMSSNHVYMNPGMDLLNGYNQLLSTEQKRYVEILTTYKHSAVKKMKLFFDLNFRRESLAGSILFKALILFNKY